MDKSPISIGSKGRQASCLRTAHADPLLSAKEEQALCLRWRDRHDTAAADRLVGCHLRMAVELARDHRRDGLSAYDLIGEAYVGLMRAICRFDPDRGVCFST